MVDLYDEDIDYVVNQKLPWEKFQGKSVLISGATGLVGSFLVDVLMKRNALGMDCKIYALCRDKEKANVKFSKWNDNALLRIIIGDVQQKIEIDEIRRVDYAFHLASNTHPLLYSTDPIGTIYTNIIGLRNMLEFAVDHDVSRFVFASSNEVYGENRCDVELFDEDYCGYINCNTLRAGYPESKRCGEALCQAYRSQKRLDIVIPRITRTYGPTMSMGDTKAISQFIIKAIRGERIVLKSNGTQLYSFTYVADAVSGILYIVLKGENGEAYNIADEKSDIMLKDLASIIAEIADQTVVYENPSLIESEGYSKATKALLNGKKLKGLGWEAKYDIRSGVERTIEILKKANKE